MDDTPWIPIDFAHLRETEVGLELRIEKLTLICRALWSFLQERWNLTEKELAQRAMEIDLLDGKADGRVSVPARKCQPCGRMMAPRHERCLYCGDGRLIDSVFETV